MERILERMQDDHSGVPVRTVKTFMSRIPSVFTGKLNQDLAHLVYNQRAVYNHALSIVRCCWSGYCTYLASELDSGTARH